MNAPQNPRRLIVCVQLAPEVTSAIRAITESIQDQQLEIREMSYLDGERILETVPEALIMCLAWDGPKGRAPAVIHRLAALTRESPTRVFAALNCRVTDKPAHMVKEIPVDGWLALPSESFKLQETLGDLLNLDEEKGPTIDRSKALTFTGTMHRRVLPSVFLSDLKDAQAARVEELKAILDDSRKRVLVFHPDEGTGSKMAKLVEKAGFCHARHVMNIESIFSALQQCAWHAIVGWYDTATPQIIGVLRELLEKRDYPMLAVGVMLPGETAKQALLRDGADLFFDLVAPLDWNQFGPFMEKTFQARANNKNARGVLEQIRRVWIAGKSAAPALAPAQIAQLSAALASVPGKAYWAQTEDALQAAARKEDAATVLPMGQEILRVHTDRFDAAMTWATMQSAYLGSFERMGEWILERLFTLQPNTERILRVARLFLKTKSMAALKSLLEQWRGNSDLAKDHRFWYVAAHHSRLSGFPADERACLYQTLIEYPWHLGAIETLAERFEAKGDFHYAARLWRMGQEASGGKSTKSLTHQVQCLIKIRRLKEAREVIDTILRDDPKNVDALKVKELLDKKSA